MTPEEETKYLGALLAQGKAAQEKAAQEKAGQEKAGQGKAGQERTSVSSPGRNDRGGREILGRKVVLPEQTGAPVAGRAVEAALSGVTWWNRRRRPTRSRPAADPVDAVAAPSPGVSLTGPVDPPADPVPGTGS
jgi:hypothetical protein